MQRNTRPLPNPDRFKDFDLIEDETGFKIKNCDHVFYFDKRGGWFDEYENYYNADGQPDRPPSDDEFDDDDDFEDYDRLAAEYDDGDDDYGDNTNYDDLFQVAENRLRLALYKIDQDIDCEIENINFKCSEDQFKREFLGRNGISCSRLEFYKNSKGFFNGTCLVTLDRTNAEKLVELQNLKYFGRDLRVFTLKPPVEDEEELEDIDPVIPGIVLSDPTPLTQAQKNSQPQVIPKTQTSTQNSSSQQSSSQQTGGGWRSNTTSQKTTAPEEKKVETNNKPQEKPKEQPKQKEEPKPETTKQPAPQTNQNSKTISPQTTEKPKETAQPKQPEKTETKPVIQTNLDSFNKKSQDSKPVQNTNQSSTQSSTVGDKKPEAIKDASVFDKPTGNGWAALPPRKKK